MIAYALEFSAQPPTLNEKHTKLRNNVVHKGEIPSTDAAEGYCNAVLQLISEVLALLRAECAPELKAVYSDVVNAKVFQRTHEVPIASTNITGSLGVLPWLADFQPSTFVDEVGRVCEMRKTIDTLARFGNSTSTRGHDRSR